MTAAVQRPAGRSRPQLAFDIATVWNQSAPVLAAELLEFWQRHRAVGDARSRDTCSPTRLQTRDLAVQGLSPVEVGQSRERRPRAAWIIA